MKKRIISLILVLATAFLTLTGCAFRYDKKDMSKYANWDKDAFYNALHAILIEDAKTFTPGSDREGTVKDTLAAELLKYTEQKKLHAGKLNMYDALFFCYYAVDEDGNIFYTDKLNEEKPTSIQLGLSNLEGFYKELSEKVLSLAEIKNYFYDTSASDIVRAGDIVSISYNKAWDADGNAETGANGKEKSEVVWHEYGLVGELDNITKNLIGTRVGEEKRFDVTETKTDPEKGEVTTVYDFSNVKVEHIVKTADTQKVEDGDSVFVTYTLTFDGTQYYNENTDTYDLPETLNGEKYEHKVVDGNKIQITVTCALIEEVEADADGTAEDAKTFLGQLVGKKVGEKTSAITEKNVTFGDYTVDFEYTNVTVNWIVNDGNCFEVEYTPDELKEDKSNKVALKNAYGEEFELNGKKLTYCVFPVYYVDVVDAFSEDKDVDAVAKLLLTELANTVAKTQTVDDVTSYIFKTLNDTGYVNNAKTLASIITEGDESIVKLSQSRTSAKSAMTTALDNLKKAQKALADNTDSTKTESLKTALSNAETDYKSKFAAYEVANIKLEEKVNEALGCKKGEAGVAESLVNDYRQAKYDELDAAYRKTIKDNLSTEIGKLVKQYITFDGKKLPKRAVKAAYKNILNSYKQSFYEGNYTSSDKNSQASAAPVTNYEYYKGNFNRFLVDKVLQGAEGGVKEAKAKLKAAAEESVKEIIYIYALTQFIEEAWDNADITVKYTNKEKKEIEESIQANAYQYYQYYGYIPTFEDIKMGNQLEKAFGFLLETVEVTDENGVKVDSYKNIAYKVK